jgi:hypothetical protein
MKNKIKTIALAMSLICMTSLSAQNLVVTLTNSTTESFPVSEIQSIKFGPETMILNEFDGTVNTWNIDDVDNYAFDGVANINESATVKTDELNVYPNPASNKVQINFSSNRSGEISIDVYDMHGRLIEKLFHGIHQDETLLTWYPKQDNAIQSGNYLIKITATNKVITKPIIIQ